jgi:hypothetical protein
MGVLRGTGRTQFMIDELIDAVLDGQPLCRVVAHNKNYAKDLMFRVANDLSERGLRYRSTHDFRLYVMNTEITFHSSAEMDNFMRGREHYDCQFWDHHALECLEEKLDD